MEGNRAEQNKSKRQRRAKHGPLRAQQRRKRQGRTEHGPLRAQHRIAGRGRDERSTDRCARCIEELEEAGANGARTAARAARRPKENSCSIYHRCNIRQLQMEREFSFHLQLADVASVTNGTRIHVPFVTISTKRWISQDKRAGGTN